MTIPIQTLNDGTKIFSIDFQDRKMIRAYLDPKRKTKPKLYTREEFAKLGGMVALYLR